MMLSQRTIKNSRIAQWCRNFANSNAVAKAIVSVIIWVGALIPVWLYFLTRWLIEPDTFWQEFAIFCVFAIGIGWLQVILGIGGFVLTLVVLADD